MTNMSYCSRRACKKIVEGNVARCPDCNSTMFTTSKIKQTGWVLIVVGAFIAIPMIFVNFAFFPTLMDPQSAVANGKFGGTADMVPVAAAMLFCLFGFGATLLVAGLHRAYSGRRSALYKVISLIFIGTFALMLYFFAIALGK